eukprot:9230627-Alexandrium_andersonii.AAC.1
MEAPRASCCSEFQAARGSQQLHTTSVENIKAQLADIPQQMRHLDQRLHALEPQPTGVRPESSGAALTQDRPSPA